MPTAFCVEEDVRQALQEQSLSGATGSTMVAPAINGASNQFARATNGHWFDSSATPIGGDVDTAAATATNVRIDVPSSPHRTDRQLLTDVTGARYPVTHAGPYARIPLPHLHVSTVNALEVRDPNGGVTDWVVDASITEGRGDDYYVEREGQNSYGRTYLYVRAASIGARVDFGGLLTLNYDYGLDWATEEWHDVRRGIANLAAAEVIDQDSVLAQIPDNGQLIGVDTQHQNLVDAARNYLDPYISSAGNNR